jgi:hypothetical protein
MTVHSSLSGPKDPLFGEARRWRVGGKNPMAVYEQRGAVPDRRAWPEGDRPVTMFRTPEDAALAVAAVNAYLDQREARRA